MRGVGLFLTQCTAALLLFLITEISIAYTVSHIKTHTVTAVIVQDVDLPKGVWM